MHNAQLTSLQRICNPVFFPDYKSGTTKLVILFIFNFQFSTLNSQLLTLNSQLSTLNS